MALTFGEAEFRGKAAVARGCGAPLGHARLPPLRGVMKLMIGEIIVGRPSPQEGVRLAKLAWHCRRSVSPLPMCIDYDALTGPQKSTIASSDPEAPRSRIFFPQHGPVASDAASGNTLRSTSVRRTVI